MTSSVLYVVAGLIYNKTHQILIAQRPLHKPLGGLWEFPGGKIENNESPFEALERELFEETGIYNLKAQPFMTVTVPYTNLRAFYLESVFIFRHYHRKRRTIY
jgi:8-oxo-dGTP diphosphatase